MKCYLEAAGLEVRFSYLGNKKGLPCRLVVCREIIMSKAALPEGERKAG